MSETWADVRAGETGVSLTTIVGGISLALRHARTADRVGLTGLRFTIADDDERGRVQAQFAAHPPPDGLAMEFVASSEAPARESVLVLEGSAIYLRDTLLGSMAGDGRREVAPDFPLRGPGDVAPATRFLYGQIRKSVTLDGVIAYYIMRPLARVVTRLLLNTSVSPNQATLAALACGVAAAICAAMGGATFAIFAGLFYWSGGVLDCVDGELARLRLQSSKIGEWLDSMVDEFSTISLVVGLGIGLASDGAGDHWLFLGIGAAILGVIGLTPMYADLHRRGLAIDTAQFPWFFGNTNAAEDQGSVSFIGKLINGLGYFIRRDANITGTSLLLMFNYRAVALSIILGAFVVTCVLVVCHYTVMGLRNRAA